MPLAAGRLNTLVELRAKESVTKDSGAEKVIWRKLGVVWAEVTPISGREAFAAQQRFAEAEVRFTIRFESRLLATAEVLYQGRVFDVISILELPGGAPERLEVFAKARAD